MPRTAPTPRNSEDGSPCTGQPTPSKRDQSSDRLVSGGGAVDEGVAAAVFRYLGRAGFVGFVQRAVACRRPPDRGY